MSVSLSNQSTIRLNISSGPGRRQVGMSEAIITIPPNDPTRRVTVSIIPPTVTAMDHGLDEGQKATVMINASRSDHSVTIQLATPPYLRANPEQITIPAGAESSATFVLSALSDQIVTHQPRADTVIVTTCK